ncbi:MAG: ABC transporter ATP-binding protein [Meiothermus sp.]|uniref:ABC transporter ATP-binding protein n=1 Tax=Meiothermus sp. TaxID=1955249 RepID=UPI0025CCD289|nr:ABC transporter ATP-binding protein [Meiothermus sp.]MCS7058252.1 ABC transporter ATP-binding protein [Meiothermus sp.]MCS7194837.1 ABC transporter ATP-binding protein [Meiothermus sp.]MCX7739396.1 ABC transporter ATP-binding protein [Meiothermus sp.]MDW8090369.1 ABC transporter ATP-binding protein [Meiothermus sp.]MDW8481129.1 ABC transporter ATP-binding protein [Meiothermus sp.]
MNPLLQIEGLEAFYGPSQVLFGVSLEVGQGQVATLLGRNGMGKTSTVRSIMGLIPTMRGRIRFAGQPIEGLPPERIAALGIGLVPEGRQIFPNLTVEENLVAFAANRSQSPNPWTLGRVYELFPRLRERRHHLGHQLSGGEQQMLAIGRALMTNPRLLILDEATEGLAPLLREEIWRVLRLLKEGGQTILVIDKYLERLFPLADQHTILERGRVVWQGTSQELKASPEVWKRYLSV